ncbi:tetratricopeptide repeat protein [Nonomuraea dietziae]|uniref:tetratricopeptide repeat protein n=1 Tax=Nonomuraea dietziae TaxID=65515 RepID=UPI00332B495E
MSRELYEALRALEHCAKAARKQAKQVYSRRETAKALAAPPYEVDVDGQRISSWIPEDPARAQTPRLADSDKVLALVRLWSAWAGAPEPNPRYWNNLIENAQPQRLPRSSSEVGWPIGALTDPYALEVHPAIEVAGQATGLPAYVRRDHDARLDEAVRRAEGGQSTLAVLVGGSSTGKTRACWEALHKLRDSRKRWRLWHPIDPGRPEAAAETLSQIGPRTVVWLNETQFYLSPEGLGERVAAGLRELLRDPSRGPVLVLGTLWPEYWAALTTAPPAGSPDPHAQVRALLTGVGIHVPESFSDREVDAVRRSASGDARLALAGQQAADGRITQFLAGVPALLERYHNAPPVAKALIHVAMDVRRLGLSFALPYELLHDAAPGYLTDQQWDEAGDDWLERALAYVAAPCRGVRGPVTRVRPRPGRPAPATPCYRLADYLEQHGRESRRGLVIPGALWEALAHRAPAEARPQIAKAAQERGVLGHAQALYEADLDDPESLVGMADLLAESERLEEAISYYERAAEAGHPHALWRAGYFLEETGQAQRAILFYVRAAEAGESFGWTSAGLLLADNAQSDEDREQALTYCRRAVEAGDETSLTAMGTVLQSIGRSQEALDRYRAAVEAGDDDAVALVGELLREMGLLEEALDWCRSHADSLLLETGTVLQQMGRTQEALDWYRAAAENGTALASQYGGDLLCAEGRRDEALDSYRRACTPYAWGQAGLLLKDKFPEAETRTREALTWYRDAEDTGTAAALERTARLLAQAELTDEALGWYERAADAGSFFALIDGGDLLGKAGRTDEALRWFWRSANSGYSDARSRAVHVLWEAGRAGEADRLALHGWDADGQIRR